MSKVGDIIIGWKNYLVKDDPKLEHLAEMRMEICLSCPQLNKKTNRCKLCGCFMVAKTRVKKATCPSDKW